MPTRLVSALFLLTALPCVSQSAMQTRLSQQVDRHEKRASQVVVPNAPDASPARLQVLQHDANELSILSSAVQSDLQRLQSGLIAKDLNEKLKKMEKLSKKVRQEMQ